DPGREAAVRRREVADLEPVAVGEPLLGAFDLDPVHLRPVLRAEVADRRTRRLVDPADLGVTARDVRREEPDLARLLAPDHDRRAGLEPERVAARRGGEVPLPIAPPPPLLARRHPGPLGAAAWLARLPQPRLQAGRRVAAELALARPRRLELRAAEAARRRGGVVVVAALDALGHGVPDL